MDSKNTKKKLLLYYLILAACLLVIAAVTVTVVLTVGRNNNVVDQPSTNKPDNDGKDKPDNDDPSTNKPDDSQPTQKPIDDSYLLPLNTSSVQCRYEFAFDKTLDRYAVHQGMDFACKAGDEVLAVRDGTVTKVITDHKLGENYVAIKHKDGVISTYKYITAKEGLKEGDSVKRGDKIGVIAAANGMEMGQGEHLHFELSANGKTVNPDEYLNIAEK